MTGDAGARESGWNRQHARKQRRQQEILHVEAATELGLDEQLSQAALVSGTLSWPQWQASHKLTCRLQVLNFVNTAYQWYLDEQSKMQSKSKARYMYDSCRDNHYHRPELFQIVVMSSQSCNIQHHDTLGQAYAQEMIPTKGEGEEKRSFRRYKL